MQRVNLTTCLGASLVNTLFVMDEPSVGSHPRDVGRLVRVMHNLRDKGNTLLVVEHDEQIIQAADNLIDIGPGRGERGGELVWSGPLDEFIGGSPAPRAMPNIITERSKKSRFAASASTSPAERPIRLSLTCDYLTREKSIPIPKSRRKSSSIIKTGKVIIGVHITGQGLKTRNRKGNNEPNGQQTRNDASSSANSKLIRPCQRRMKRPPAHPI